MERKIKKFVLESLLDWHYWSVENGCTILTIHGNQFNQEQIDYFINELGRHERKTEESRFEYIARTVEEIKKEGGILFERASALIEFMRIYRIAISKFGFGKEVTPYQFLSWASSRRTFSVPQDLRLWLEEERAKLPAARKAALEAENEQLKARITELETELAACREQSPNTKTSAATKARQEKNLAEWKNAFKAMIPVILQCQEEGPKPRTTPELATMCAKNGVTLDKTKMAFLRECLRECLGTEYVNTTGGPTIQG